MKNYLMFALILCAIPAVALGQSVSCDGCTHSVSVYMGEGGLIAMTDADMVTYVASCNGVTRTGEMMPNDDGMVSMLLAGDLACHGDDKSSFELGPIDDGGWYWITMETNSAVGGLVANDVLGNDTVDIADAGEGVTMTSGSGAVLLTETATGRTGLLPNILPEPPAAAVNTCSYTTSGTPSTPVYTPETSNCMLGDGGTMIRAQGPPDLYSGMRSNIANMGSVVRPAGSVTVLVDLWGNGTGHFGPDQANARLGHAGGTPLAATLTASLAASGPGTGTDITGSVVAGMTFSVTDNVGTLTIGADAAYCGRNANHSATVSFTAVVDATQQAQVTPNLAAHPRGGATAAHTISVVCPSASANMGQELVPDNPFPTTE